MSDAWSDYDEYVPNLDAIENDERDCGYNISGELKRNSAYVENGRLVSKTSPNGVFLESLSCDVNDLTLLSSNVLKFSRLGNDSVLPKKSLWWFRELFLPIELMIKFYVKRITMFVSSNIGSFCIIYALIIGLMIGWSVMKNDHLLIEDDPTKLLISCYMFLKEALTLAISVLTVYLMIRGLVAVEKITNRKIGSSHSSQSYVEQRLNESAKKTFESEFGHHENVARMLFMFLVIGRADDLSDLDAEPLGHLHLTWLMHYSPEWKALVKEILMNVRGLSAYWCDGARTFPYHVLDLDVLTSGLAHEINSGRRDFTTFALCAIVGGLIPSHINWRTFFSRTSFIRCVHGGSSYYSDINQNIQWYGEEFDVSDIVHFYEKSLIKKNIRFGCINGVVIVPGGFVPNGCSILP